MFCEGVTFRRNSGFTLVELMVVVLIITILSAIGMSFQTRFVDSAKWTEGKTGCGAIATSLRGYYAQTCGEGGPPADVKALGFGPGDLEGKYFTLSDYQITDLVWTATELEYKIVCVSTKENAPGTPGQFNLYSSGEYELILEGEN
ncbi:PilD-dependent protein PddA [Limihaloglobus sulfuriphilus]|uniref:PilD-dependent protein PddA n=1 Tax=Limihaloglobus sulfuriphilus TaxID=1851148 RepID=A0A1Q2MHK3_9BACT|nr:prepilin-type N-terminal cleavage/methylation domain-containing protein [Limihaloglobus sulfuriphilus]AQQ72008.1 PilD-dependent protein PddA [Limihaloglobus sulfuriphilus]